MPERVLILAIGEVPMKGTPPVIRGGSGSCGPVSTKVNQLFAAFHLRGCDEETDADAAAAVGRVLGRSVLDREITQLRTGRREQNPDPEFLAALSEHFCVPVTHLTGREDVENRGVDQALRLMVSIRDLGPAAYHL
ncbi:hypothetical protein ACIBEK_06315 [Nocardia fusca]|uniref:hypothetical protein n=1 Tax=Nocardia fusca TaxID=941183 RepID=UPI0037B18EAE